MNWHPINCSIVLALASLLAPEVQAADYVAGLAVNAHTDYNDNIRLTKDNKIAVTGYGLSPNLIFDVQTETSKIDLNTDFDFNRHDKSEFNTNDQHVGLTLSRQLERNSFSLNASYIHDTTLTSETPTTGRIGNQADRAENYSLSPSWTYTLTEANLIQLQGSYTKQDYASLAYIGYKNIGAQLSWIHLINERLKLSAAATYSDYKSDNLTLEVPANFVDDFSIPTVIFPGQFGEQNYATRTRSTGAQIGVDYQWSEHAQITAHVGRAQVRTDYVLDDPQNICADSLYSQIVADNGPIGSACELQKTTGSQSNVDVEWNWSNEQQQFNFNVTKLIQPTSNGYAVDAIELHAGWIYQLSELNKFSVNLSATRNRAMDQPNLLQNTSIADRNYGSAALQYQRQLSDIWLLNAGVVFSEQKYTQIDHYSSSRIYSLGLSYSPRQWHWAR